MSLQNDLLCLVEEYLLEGHAERAIRREAHARMSRDELKEYVAAMRRRAARGEPAEEDLPILRRFGELYEEAKHDLQATP